MALGHTFVWIGPFDGQWSAPANWSDITSGTSPAAVAPGSFDAAVFNTPAGQTQTIVAASVSVGSVMFNGANVVTGTLNAGTVEVLPGGTLADSNFDLLTIDNGGTVLGNAVNFTTVVVSGLLIGQSFTPNPNLIVIDPAFIGYTPPRDLLTGTGTVEVSDTGRFDAKDFDVTGALTFKLDNNATMAIRQNLTAGGIDLAGTGDILQLFSFASSPTLVGTFVVSGTTLVITYGDPSTTIVALPTIESDIVGFGDSDAVMTFGLPVTGVDYDAGSRVLSLFNSGTVVSTLKMAGDFSGESFVLRQFLAPVVVAPPSPSFSSTPTTEIVLSLPAGPAGPSAGTGTPDQYVWTGPLAGDWNNPANWTDITSGGSPPAVAPGIDNHVTITEAPSGRFRFISGTANAATLTLIGNQAVLGQINTGSLDVRGHGSDLDIQAGASISAATASFTDISGGAGHGPDIVVDGSGAALTIAGTLAMAGTEGEIYLLHGGTMQVGGLVTPGIYIDPTSSALVGSAGSAAPGALTIGSGGRLTLAGSAELGAIPFPNPYATAAVFGDVHVMAGGTIVATSPAVFDEHVTIDLGGMIEGPVAFSYGSLINNGVIASASLLLGHTSGTGVVEVLDDGVAGVFADINAGSLTLRLDNRASLFVSGSIGTGNTILLAGTDDLLGIDRVVSSGHTILPSIDSTISGFSSTDTIAVTGVPLDSAQFTADPGGGSGTLKLFNHGTQEASLHLTGDFRYAAGHFQVDQVSANEWDITAPCFAAGTRIRTPRGMVAVERLREGDTVLTVSGGRQRIQWIGHRRVDVRRHAHPERVMPVRIAAHAFGAGRPARPVLLSPDHSVFVEDVLIPIKFLINDSTVTQVGVDAVTYYHLELPRHDVLLADGLPAESYLETGGRSAFENGGGALQLHPDFAPDEARVAMVWRSFGYAPLLGEDGQLERARTKLAWQAALLARTPERRSRRRA